MTDTPSTKGATMRETVERNLPGRRRSEFIFRSYGLIGLMIAFLALLILMMTVFKQAGSTVTAYNLTVPMTLRADMIDPSGNRDPDQIRDEGDVYGLVREYLDAQFPNVQSSRDLNELGELLVPLATTGLNKLIQSDPKGWVDARVNGFFPISDDVDLYLKGGIGQERTFSGSAASISDVVLADGTTAIDVRFAKAFLTDEAMRAKEALKPMLEEAKAGLPAEQAAAAEAQSVLTASLAKLEAAKAANVDAEKLAEAEALVAEEQNTFDLAQGAVSEAQALIADLEGRIASKTPEIPLNDTMRSVLLQINGGMLKAKILAADHVVATEIVPMKNREAGKVIVRVLNVESERKVSDAQVAFTRLLEERGLVTSHLNTRLLTANDSREPELAGMLGSIIGSLLTLFVTMLIAVPVGVAAAIYLEEFAPKNWLTDLIEVNINNLAAVPSIVYGLLGLGVLLNAFGMPRSAPVVGGLVLAMITLPTVIIAARAAIKAVPPSIREAALGVGASKVQSVFHHVLPLATPGIMTGAILGLAHALGETAPLMLIGMVAFIGDIPTGFTSSATVLPVQVFMWAGGSERAWEPKTAAAIIVLLVILVVINAIAVYVRRKFERRW